MSLLVIPDGVGMEKVITPGLLRGVPLHGSQFRAAFGMAPIPKAVLSTRVHSNDTSMCISHTRCVGMIDAHACISKVAWPFFACAMCVVMWGDFRLVMLRGTL